MTEANFFQAEPTKKGRMRLLSGSLKFILLLLGHAAAAEHLAGHPELGSELTSSKLRHMQFQSARSKTDKDSGVVDALKALIDHIDSHFSDNNSVLTTLDNVSIEVAPLYKLRITMPAEDAARETNGLAGASFEGFVVDAGKLGMHVVDVQQVQTNTSHTTQVLPQRQRITSEHVASGNGIQTPTHQSPKNYEKLSSVELHQPRSLLADSAYRGLAPPTHSMSVLLGCTLNLIYQGQIDHFNHHALAAFDMAIKEINAAEDLLPNVHLQYSLVDDKCDEATATDAAFNFLSLGVDAVLGTACSSTSLTMQNLLPYGSVPQVSFFATSSSFSPSLDGDGEDPYPYFMRTVASDTYQARAMADLVHFYGWRYAVTVAIEDDYGLSGISAFHDNAAALGIAITAQLTYAAGTSDFSEVVRGLQEARCYIIVTFGFSTETGMLMEQAYASGVGGAGYVWIGSEATASANTWEAMSSDLSEEARNDIMRGFLALTPSINKTTPEYLGFVERWASQPATVNDETGECSEEVDALGAPIWKRYDVDEDLTTYDACVGMNFSKAEHQGDNILTSAFSIYDATYVVGRALHELLWNQSREVLVGEELRDAMLAQAFLGVSGPVAFDSAGDRSVGLVYEVVNHAGNSDLLGVAQWSVEQGYVECGADTGGGDCWPVQWSTGMAPPRHSMSILLGSVFWLYRDGYSRVTEHALAAFDMAIKEINAAEDLLPNVHLQYSFVDDKCDEATANDAAFNFLSLGVDAVLGTACSSTSLTMQNILPYGSVPQVSFFATSSSFSPSLDGDGEDPYPYFMRTVASDTYQARAMADLVHFYGWRYAVTVAIEDDYGLSGISAFHDNAAALGIAITAQLTYAAGTSDFSEVVRGLQEARCYIIVTFGFSTETGMLMEQAYASGVGGAGYVWIGSEGTARADTWEAMSSDLSEEARNDIMRGFLALTPSINKTTPEYLGFVERWASQPATVNDETGECSEEVDALGAPIWKRYDVDEDLTTYDACVGMNFSKAEHQGDNILASAFSMYDATYVVGRALHELLWNQSREVLVGEELRDAMLAQAFLGVSGPVAFDSAGDRSVGLVYEVVNHAGNSDLRGVAQWSVEQGYVECGADTGGGDCWPVQWSTGHLAPSKEGYSLVGIALALLDNGVSADLSAAKMAIEEINHDDSMLPNVEMKFILHDSKCNEQVGEDVSYAQYEAGVDAVIGLTCSAGALGAQHVFNRYYIPQVSGSATSTALSDNAEGNGKDPYPYFMRTVASDTYQARAMADLVHFYGWRYAVTVAIEDDYGLSGISAFHDNAAALGIAITAQLTYAAGTSDFSEVVRGLQEARCYIIVTFGFSTETGRLMEQAYASGVGGAGYVWIGSESAASADTWEAMSSDLSEEARNDIMRGFLALTPSTNKTTPEYLGFVERWASQPATVNDETGECSEEVDALGAPIWKRYDVDEDLTTYDACVGMNFSNGNMPAHFAAYYYDAAYVVGRALHDLTQNWTQGTQGGARLGGAELRDAMLAQAFLGVSGPVAFDSAGDRSVGLVYEVVNHAGNSSLLGVAQWSVEQGYVECGADTGGGDCWPVQWSTGEHGQYAAPSDGSCMLGSVYDAQIFACSICSAGTFHNTSADECALCSAGSISLEAGSRECLPCSVVSGQGYYQNREGQTTCKLCPAGATTNGITAVGKPEHWRDTSDRDLFYACLTSDACKGEATPYAGPGCREGHSGPLCEVCAEGWSRSRPFTRTLCEECASQRGGLKTWLVPGVMAALVLLVATWFLYSPYMKYAWARRQRKEAEPDMQGLEVEEATARAMTEAAFTEGATQTRPSVTTTFLQRQQLQSMLRQVAHVLEPLKFTLQQLGELVQQVGAAMGVDDALREMKSSGFEPGKLATEILAAVVSFSQVIGIFTGLVYKWPDSLKYVFETINFYAIFTWPHFLNIQCEVSLQNLPEIYPVWLIGAIFLPCIFLVLHATSYSGILAFPQLFRRTNLRALICVLFFFYPIISENIIMIIPCRSIYEDIYLLHDLATKCYTDEYQRLFGFAFLAVLVFIVGVPLFFLRTMLTAELPRLLLEKRKDARLANLVFHFSSDLVVEKVPVDSAREMLTGGLIDTITLRLNIACVQAAEDATRPKALPSPCDGASPEKKIKSLLGHARRIKLYPQYGLRWMARPMPKDGRPLPPLHMLEREAIMRAGFLFSPYRPEYWYFEVVESIRKLLLVCVQVLLADVRNQLTFTMCICASYLSCLHLIRPHANTLTRTVYVTYAYVLAINTFYAWILEAEMLNASEAVQAYMAAILAALNVVAFIVPGIVGVVLLGSMFPTSVNTYYNKANQLISNARQFSLIQRYGNLRMPMAGK
ncbi:hypothetical protein CYMTET_49646 [Cymbomonas tetramitiformis]|uniref:Receptor ligand binding region domain-containing protein n=1 Tax=Cymbomonas tetramitiformis TaxID=36881 RepID=A0AAE0EVL1_9CHLO|nr:hypothetical protein CYMTET_49646 [Cymbomonas tetramitiformis]